MKSNYLPHIYRKRKCIVLDTITKTLPILQLSMLHSLNFMFAGEIPCSSIFAGEMPIFASEIIEIRIIPMTPGEIPKFSGCPATPPLRAGPRCPTPQRGQHGAERPRWPWRAGAGAG